MVDISKCDGKNCEIRGKCRRFSAQPVSGRQSWISPKIRGEGCLDYLKPLSRPRIVDVSAYSRAHVARRCRHERGEVEA